MGLLTLKADGHRSDPGCRPGQGVPVCWRYGLLMVSRWSVGGVSVVSRWCLGGISACLGGLSVVLRRCRGDACGLFVFFLCS